MSEADLLELITMSRANFAFLVTQIIAVHFALVAGIYLFFNRAGFFLKFAIMVIYSGGYAGLLGLYFWETAAFGGMIEALFALDERTAAAEAIVSWTRNQGELQSLSSIGLFASGWLIVAFALFVPNKRDQD